MFEYAQNAAGRLYEPASAAIEAIARTCCVVGSAAFVSAAVPSLRRAGMAVEALTVVPQQKHLKARLIAQDEQDGLRANLAVPLALGPEAVPRNESFDILCVAARTSWLANIVADALREHKHVILCSAPDMTFESAKMLASIPRDDRQLLFNPICAAPAIQKLQEQIATAMHDQLADGMRVLLQMPQEAMCAPTQALDLLSHLLGKEKHIQQISFTSERIALEVEGGHTAELVWHTNGWHEEPPNATKSSAREVKALLGTSHDWLTIDLPDGDLFSYAGMGEVCTALLAEAHSNKGSCNTLASLSLQNSLPAFSALEACRANSFAETTMWVNSHHQS